MEGWCRDSPVHVECMHKNALWVVTQFREYYLFFSMNARISLSTVTRSRSWPSLHICCFLHDQTKERTNRAPTIRSPTTEGPVLTKYMRLWFNHFSAATLHCAALTEQTTHCSSQWHLPWILLLISFHLDEEHQAIRISVEGEVVLLCGCDLAKWNSILPRTQRINNPPNFNC